MEFYIKLNDFPNYEISNFGKVKNVKSGKILTNVISKRGYFVVKLVNGPVRKTKTIHRLLGIYFLNSSIDGNFIVDHIDNNPLNNNLSNLQITTKRINSTKDRISATGENCIYFSKSKNKIAFRVRIKINGVRKSFGTFNNIVDAVQKRNLVLSEIMN
jgi:hypothetical protein